MIKAVLFDIDGVLLDSLAANHQYYSEIFKEADANIKTFAELSGKIDKISLST